VERLAALVGVDDQPLTGWRDEAAVTYATVAGEVPVAPRRLVEAFLEAPPPAGGWTPVFSHNDLGIEHVLVDPDSWTVTGIIDCAMPRSSIRPSTSGCCTATPAPPPPRRPWAPIEPRPTIS
jgi:hypothetical protein